MSEFESQLRRTKHAVNLRQEQAMTDAPREITVERIDEIHAWANVVGALALDGSEIVKLCALARRALQAGGERLASVMQNGFMTCNSGGGKNPYISIEFRTLDEAYALYDFLLGRPSPSVSVEREREEIPGAGYAPQDGAVERHGTQLTGVGGGPTNPDTPQSVPACTCSKHPLWDGYDGDCPIHGWFEPVTPDSPLPKSEGLSQGEELAFVAALRNPWGMNDGVERGKSANWEVELRLMAADLIERLFKANRRTWHGVGSNLFEPATDRGGTDSVLQGLTRTPDAPLSQGEELVKRLRNRTGFARNLTDKAADFIASLIAERDKWKMFFEDRDRRLATLSENHRNVCAELAQLVEKVSVLEAALAKYGGHVGECHFPWRNDAQCTCGLNAALGLVAVSDEAEREMNEGKNG